VRVVCAWCHREGRTGFLGFREPLSDMSITHGICPDCHQKFLGSLMAHA